MLGSERSEADGVGGLSKEPVRSVPKGSHLSAAMAGIPNMQRISHDLV